MQQTSQTSTVTKRSFSTKALVLIALMTAITCILAPWAIPLPVSPVPVTLGTFALYISVFVLGWKYAAVSCLIYLLTGLVGLPVFSGFSGGFGKIAGPTGGYLIGYLFLVIIAGLFIDHFPDKKYMYAIGLVLGTAVTYAFGTVWLSVQMGLSFGEGLTAGVIPYLPGDIAKIIIAMIAGPILRKRLAAFTQ